MSKVIFKQTVRHQKINFVAWWKYELTPYQAIALEKYYTTSDWSKVETTQEKKKPCKDCKGKKKKCKDC